MSRTSRRFNLLRATLALVIIAVSIVGIFAVRNPEKLERLLEGDDPAYLLREKLERGDVEESSQGTENGGSGGESAEMLRAMTEFAEARTAPSGIVSPGAYSAAYSQLSGLSTVGGAWSDITAVKYDADDPDYRDYYSNSSGGAGLVTGRITGMAADNAGHVYAAGADGGVWRSSSGGGNWTPIADALPSLSSGDLELGSDGALWFATGEANTGGTSYVGSGVYRLTNPSSGSFAPSNRVGGAELESTTINSLRFTKTRVYAATLRGVWFHAIGAGANLAAPWTLAYAPNPGYLPASLQQYSTTQTGFGSISIAGNSNAAYKNIVNDIAIDPKNENHVIAAIGWRSGDTYNGFYESNDNATSWSKINPQGGIDTGDIGYVNFAFSKNGDKLYAINQSPKLLNKLTGTVNSLLDGIYVSNNGSPTGPWSKIAESTKLANSGSALKQAVGGKGYGPGIQAWYNQFIIVDPNDANHVYAGLEEVYETKDGGSSWATVGPYWNFSFSCWNQNVLYPPDGASGANGCPQTTHSDQHSIAIGTAGGKQYVFVGNDGGVYRRPLNGAVNANGNGTDWESLNDGTIDALQYYAVGVGKTTAESNARPDLQSGGGVLVSGGLQDNGGSLVRPGAAKMVSNFGGDGGDVFVDPNNGCNIVQEYVALSMSVTQTCANPGPDHPNAFLDLSQSTTYKIAPPDVNARFIAPFVGNATNVNEWLAGGSSLWVQNKGFAIRSGSEWKKAYTLPSSAQVYTALAMKGDKAVGGWCGPCNNAGFARGITIGKRDASSASGWTFSVASVDGLPLRYIGGVAIGPNGEIYASINGFSRRFTEGEGAGIGHVFKYDEPTAKWIDISANFPDVPANSVQALSNGSLIVATDLAVLYRAPGATTWQRLGTGLPLTVALDVELGPDGNVYAATHGRGIWRMALPATTAK